MNLPAVAVSREIVESTLKPLWACWRALYAAREKREPLDLDLPERRVVLDEKGRILSVAPRERLDAHKLIEDYMIAANVAAAKALEAKKAPVMYRIHEPPSREKLVALKDYLKTFGIEFALGQVVRPADLQPYPRSRSRGLRQRRRPGRYPAADHGAGAAHPDPGLLQPRKSRPFRPRSWAATPISPARSAATPISSSTARWCAPTAWARAG